MGEEAELPYARIILHAEPIWVGQPANLGRRPTNRFYNLSFYHPVYFYGTKCFIQSV